MKRLLDFSLALFGLIVFSPVLIVVLLLVYLQDYHNPIYSAPRVGKGEKLYKMHKIRSMIMNADKSGVDSTGAGDKRITAIGHFVRRYKLDELPQLWNVLKGEMSFVGPRPNVKRETDLYTPDEKGLLSVQPGITDFSSIVFSDEGDILKDSKDPDLDYNQLIRPWKSRLGLVYIKNSSVGLDLQLIFLTAVAILSKRTALDKIQGILEDLGVDDQLKRVARREDKLFPHPPPGATEVVAHR